MKSYLSGTLIGVALASAPALAEPKMEQTLVTGTRTPQPVFESLSAATVLDRSAIERTQASNLFELMARVPGVTFSRNGGRGAATSLFLRGNQNGHTLLLVDGVRVGSATLGSAPLQHYNLDLIDRIEIVRGPKSSLYGSDAIGGVVNLLTRKGGSAAPLAIETGFGTNSTQEHSLTSSFANGGHSASLALGHQYTDGIDHTEGSQFTNGDDDAYRNSSAALSYRWQRSEQFGAGVSYQISDAEVEYDTGCTDSASFNEVACSPFSKDRVSALSGDFFARPMAAWKTSLRLGYSIDESKNRADEIDLSTTFSGGDFKTSKQEATWQNDIGFAGNQLLTLGVEYVEDKVSGTTDYAVDSRDNTALFAQLQLDLAPLDLLFGVRNDDNQQFGSETTFDAGLGFALNDNLRLFASYGEGFKAPTFNDLYFPDFGNPDFVPEESENIDLELRGDTASGGFSIAIFQNDLENLIQFNSAIGAADQTAEARIRGMEASLTTSVYGWQLGLVANVLDTEDKTTGQALPRIAEKTAHLDIDRGFGPLSLGLSIQAEDSRFDDAEGTDKLSGFATVDLRAVYDITNSWQVKLKLENIFDRNYATARDFSQGLYRQPGFEALFSVVYTPAM